MLVVQIVKIIGALIVLSILVIIHELGHFLVAKKLGITVEEFGIGLPPRLWGKKIGSTIYSINKLPIGGFVRLAGEDLEDDHTKVTDPKLRRKLFWARSKRDKSAVLLAGVGMNFLLAVVIISFIFTRGLSIPSGVRIDEIVPNSPAQVAGLQVNDEIVRINGTETKDTQKVVKIIDKERGHEVKLLIKRNVQELEIAIVPRVSHPQNEGALGIKMEQLIQELKYSLYQAPFYGLLWSLKFSYEMLATVFELLFNLITFKPVNTEQFGGPVAIIGATAQAFSFGIMEVLKFMSLISLNLAIFNLLPIPALDGGRLFFVIFEKWIGKHIKPRAEQLVHQVGMVFLLGLIVLITINDLVRLIQGKIGF